MTYAAKEESRFDNAPVEFYLFTMGSTTWHLTSSDLYMQPTGSGAFYTPTPIKRTDQDFSQEDDQASIEVSLPVAHEIVQLFLPWNPPSSVRLQIFRRHRNDTELITRFDGVLTAIRLDGGWGIFTCRPWGGAFSHQVPKIAYQSQCNWALYGPGCGVSLVAFTETGVAIETIAGNNITATIFGTHPDGWYKGGFVKRANGDRRMVVGHVGTYLGLIAPFVGLLVGDLVSASAGCDHTETDCRVKFDNLVNHLGMPRIPQRNPMGGGSVT